MDTYLAPIWGPIWGHHTYLLLHFQRRVDIITLWLVWQEL